MYHLLNSGLRPKETVLYLLYNSTYTALYRNEDLHYWRLRETYPWPP